jgi:hypothetical protein
MIVKWNLVKLSDDNDDEPPYAKLSLIMNPFNRCPIHGFFDTLIFSLLMMESTQTYAQPGLLVAALSYGPLVRQ